MTIRDIVKKFTIGEITYSKVVSELKSLNLDGEDYEDVLFTIDKIREVMKNSEHSTMSDPREDLDHSNLPFLGFVPNEWCDEIIFETANKISAGTYPDIVVTELQDTYNLSSALAAYFFSEAETRVRLKTLNEEEFEAVGTQWNIMQEEKRKEEFIRKMRHMVPVVVNNNDIAESQDEDNSENE